MCGAAGEPGSCRVLGLWSIEFGCVRILARQDYSVVVETKAMCL